MSVVLGPRLFPTAEAPEPPLEVALAVGQPDLAVVSEPYAPTSASGDGMVVLDGVAPSVTTSTTTATTTSGAAEPDPSGTEATVESTTSTTSTTVQRLTTTSTTSTTSSTSSTALPAKESASSTTTTTEASAVSKVAPAPHVEQSAGTQRGSVSWYELEGARPGICAHRILDKGTVVTVTNLATGASITCTVGDRGPYSGDDKVLDLFRDDFARLAPLEEGVVAARLDW